MSARSGPGCRDRLGGRPRRVSSRGVRGFSLAELAVVLLIVTLLIGGLLVPLSAQIEQRNLERTRRSLDEARDALIGFAAANGRLPCPASPASNGRESFCIASSGACPGVANQTTTVQAHGNCSHFFNGLLPAATLGLTPADAEGFLIDGWGTSDRNRVRYAVSDRTVNGVTFAWTSSGATAGPRAAGLTQLAATGQDYLYICSGMPSNEAAPCAPAVKLADNAPAVIYSVGANATSTASGTAGDELANPNPNGGTADRTFVSHTPSPAGGTGGEFDDVVTWVPLTVMLNRMVAAGQLP